MEISKLENRKTISITLNFGSVKTLTKLINFYLAWPGKDGRTHKLPKSGTKEIH